MADEEKKVSFGFSKTIKKSVLQIQPKQPEKKVDYIECLDEKGIRVVGGKEEEKQELVIPMLGAKTWCDRILNKTDADIFEPKENKNGEIAAITNGKDNTSNTELMDVTQIKKEVVDEADNAPKTLEEQAAQEIIQEMKNKDIKVENPDLVLPITEIEELHGKEESTLEDYDQIPIEGFGLAVLRGMGWKPGKGIGKNEKFVAATVPELRPRGMGLGADKLSIQKLNNQPRTKEEEQLKLEKGSFVKVITGKLCNNYGQVDGFDDGAGRLIVKMALSGETLSLNENVVQPVTKADFAKNSQVLNATKFEKYKNRTQGNDEHSTWDSESSEDRASRARRTERLGNSSGRKKSKKRSKYSSDEDSDSDEKSKKRKSDSESDYEYKQKKSKKSKKSRRRDSSSERSSKKNKKKDKERERTKERRTDYSESSERRQHKRHKRSRSRSPRRR